MPNIFAAYQSKLRAFFFQGSIYFLLFTILLTATRIFLVGDWQSIAKVIIYSIVIAIMTKVLRVLRQEIATSPHDYQRTHNFFFSGRVPTNRVTLPPLSQRTQWAIKAGMSALMLTATIYIAITPHALFLLGVVMLATILFFSVLSAEPRTAHEWLGLAIALFISALTFRQVVPAFRIDYSLDLLLTLYLFPPFFFWLCAKVASNLLNHLTELLAVGQELEADLRQSELQYQQLLQTMNEGFVIVDEDEEFLYVNDKFCEMVGYTRDELVGQNHEQLLRYDEPSQKILHAQTAMRKHHHRSTYEVTVQRKDDAPIHLLISAVPRLNEAGDVSGSSSVVMDITQRKAMEEMLRSERAQLSIRVDERTASLRSATEALQKELIERKQIEVALRIAEEEYRTLFDNIPIGLYRTSLSGRQMRANPALVKLNGYQNEQELLAAITDIATQWYVDPTRRTQFQAELDKAGIVRNFESQVYRHKTREKIWVTETAILIRDDEGNPLYYQGSVQDITERRVNEEARERLIVQLAKVARLKDEFLASMSHELRTPLNSILGMTEALQDEIYGAISTRQRKALSTVESSGRHLLALINDILDLAKIESGQVELVIDAVDLVALCDATLRLVQPTAKKRSITIEFRLPDTVKVLMADGRRLKQMLINLLSNAIKFTPEGGHIGLEIAANEGPPSEITFVVWDTGVGIPEEAKEHLFAPFVQVDSSLSRRYEGTGLGLALVKGMTELHGGTIDVESQLDHGSRFVITLPWHLPGATMDGDGCGSKPQKPAHSSLPAKMTSEKTLSIA